LFYLEFIATADGSTSEVLEMITANLVPEVYDGEAEAYPLNLDYRDGLASSVDKTFYLGQNRPNPFSNTTEIQFYLPENAEVIFNVYDVTGKVLYNRTRNYEAGNNVISLNAADLNANGVLYYSMKTENWSGNKKMLLIK